MCCAVWDSSIVMAKYFEMHGRAIEGKRCLDLSAGCGLVGASPDLKIHLKVDLLIRVSYYWIHNIVIYIGQQEVHAISVMPDI